MSTRGIRTHMALALAAELAKDAGWDLAKFQDEGAAYFLADFDEAVAQVPEVPGNTEAFTLTCIICGLRESPAYFGEPQRTSADNGHAVCPACRNRR